IMTLSDLASLGSFVSGAAVLVSLVFLYFQLKQVNEQVKQAERNQKALIQQSRAARTMDHLDRVADAANVTAYFKGYFGSPDITLAEQRQFRFFFRSTLYGFEDAFFQHHQGVLDDASFQSHVAAMKSQFARPGCRAAWKQQRPLHEPSFITFVDRV